MVTSPSLSQVETIFRRGPSGGDAIDIGVSLVAPTACGIDTSALLYGDYLGPVEGAVFAVPAASSQLSISAEAAHLVFAAGGSSRTAPWTDPSDFFVGRPDVRRMAASAIGADPVAWWGTAGSLLAALLTPPPQQTPPDLEASIGVTTVHEYDIGRGQVAALAFQQRGQSVGYFPDSGPTAFDKINVRDGHYPIWSAIHLATVLDGTGSMSPAAAAVIVPLVAPHPVQELLDGFIGGGYVPQCAMQVMRGNDESLAPFEAPVSCGCYFDQKTTGRTSCHSCTTTADCAAGTTACNYGFCEAR